MHAADAIYDHAQHDFPLHSHPYGRMAESLGWTEKEVLNRFAGDLATGRISRIGAVFAPNVIGVSTLAAIAVPSAMLDWVADRVSANSTVSHNYARAGHRFNLWFVAGARDRVALDAELATISAKVGQSVLDLPLEREYHIDLGFPLSNGSRSARAKRVAKHPAPPCLDDADWRLIAALEAGLPIMPQPYEELAGRCGLPVEHVLVRLRQWCDSGVIRRFGVVLHHRQFGYRHNAMCVWNLPDHAVDSVGERLARLPQVTLCYRRTRRQPSWPYNLFAMVHARDPQALCAACEGFDQLPELAGAPSAVLIGSHCYKQRGMRYAALPEGQ